MLPVLKNLSPVYCRCTCLVTSAIILFACATAAANPAYTVKDFESWPISVVEGSAIPQVMINASNDHQLFFKAYNDYSDLDGNGIPETTYDTTIDYYGYFDSAKCYAYNAADIRFEPRGMADSLHYCTGSMDSYWSGNFLNWASMARIDVIRKILFGGHRRSDTPPKPCSSGPTSPTMHIAGPSTTTARTSRN
jgi:hypothetical protein